MAEEKFLDDIGDTPAPPPAEPEPEPAAEAAPAPDEPGDHRPQAERDEARRKEKEASAARTAPSGYVPKQALEDARREAKEARDRALILEDRTNKILERYFSENKQETAQQDEPDLGPDPDEDPIGALKWAREQRAKDIAERREAEARRDQQTEAEKILAVKVDEYAATREQFPAIEEARQAVLKGWAREFALQGFRGAALTAKVDTMEADYAIWAHRRNIPIGNVIAQLAMARGWQPPADDAPAKPAEVDGAAERMRDATGKFVSPEAEKAERIKTSQERNGSISGAPGTPIEKMTAKELASLPEEEIWRRFEGVKNSKGKKDFDRRMNFS